MSAGWDQARAVADAVLYEGYLLYPYRANSRKNQARWQFGVLGPQGAADAGIGEDDSLSAQIPVNRTVTRRFRSLCAFCSYSTAAWNATLGGGRFEPVAKIDMRDPVVAQLG